eukprot:CAMPEP_0201285890 /NCGR_PEP_ID=MMETSP1317-20130820/113970_1 /ASSEMBLY_ACC=CAM_ASM_000770 /TAXON_ID=187299 /ORGANISM="Undescribed Undescribed, Strain Undescribed" /LENGTH=94 /DNA_ID=CAMNT_0047612033 /DNA_START=1601 /DNA_END=1885 /DNA_ORIENTATION=+
MDQEVNTPTHFYDSYVDSKYHWNEWELRRQALKMADIRQKATSAVQTDLSNMRRDNETQVYKLRDNDTQSGITVGTQLQTSSYYNVGLRDARIK